MLHELIEHRKRKPVPFYENRYEWSDGDPILPLELVDDNKHGKKDVICFVLITVISLFTHLYKLADPGAICFDESYFGNFTLMYMKREYFIDIHPPVGKLVLYFGGVLSNFHSGFPIWTDSLGAQYDNDSYVKLRLVNALFASLCPSLLFLCLRTFGLSVTSSVVSSVMMAFENSMIIEGKFILTDGILHCFVMLAVYSISLCVKGNHLMLCGVCVGLAAATKQTSWSLFAVVFFAFIVYEFQKDVKLLSGLFSWTFINKSIIRTIVVGVVSVVIYVASFCIHLVILKNPGPDSVMICREMALFPLNSSGACRAWEECKKKPLVTRLVKLMVHMHTSNMETSDDQDQHASRWWKWPLMTAGPITYFSESTRRIFLHIQPWNGFFVVVNLVVFALIWYFIGLSNSSSRSVRTVVWKGLIFFLGYFISLLPFAMIPRCLYYYHYIIALMFGISLIAFTIEVTLMTKRRVGWIISIIAVAGSLLSYMRYFPWTYGLPCENHTLLKVWKSWII